MIGVPPPTADIGCALGVGQINLRIDITSAARQLATWCLIQGVSFRGQAKVAKR